MMINFLRRRRRSLLGFLGLFALLMFFFPQQVQDVVINYGTVAKDKEMTLSENIHPHEIVVGQFERLARLVMGGRTQANSDDGKDIGHESNKTTTRPGEEEEESQQASQEEHEEDPIVEEEDSPADGPPIDVPEDFAEAVKSRVDSNGMIITPAVIDDGYLDNARNLYVSSIQRLNLTANTLFICISKSACAEARNKYKLPAVMYKESAYKGSGFFDSGAFVQKAMMKHHLIYDIIKMGYDVLLTDLDIYFFKDPVEYLRKSCIDNKRDFVIQSEAGNALNIGFMYVRPTPASLKFYAYVTKVASKKGAGGAQSMFNRIAKSKDWKTKIKYGVLALTLFPDGYSYFEKQKRMVPIWNPCKTCYICHNNWIVGTIAKTYRFKEHMMWYLDDDKYYSDDSKKFIFYENPLGRTPQFAKDEIEGLKSALAISLLTNRTLILPRTFHTKKTTTQMNGVLLIQEFENEFGGKYRESTFLDNHLVPEKIKAKKNQCGSFLINNNYNKAAQKNSKTSGLYKNFKTVFTPADGSGASQSEIQKWLLTEEMEKCSVLRFHNLYHAFKGFDNAAENEAFKKKIARGMVPGQYRQLTLLRKNKKH